MHSGQSSVTNGRPSFEQLEARILLAADPITNGFMDHSTADESGLSTTVASNTDWAVGNAGGGGTVKFTDDFEDGNDDGWSWEWNAPWPWAVIGNFDVANVYGRDCYVVTNNDYYYNVVGDDNGARTLGALSMADGTDFGDMTMTAKVYVASGDTRKGGLDSALVFGYQDIKNYYYFMLSTDSSWSELRLITDQDPEDGPDCYGYTVASAHYSFSPGTWYDITIIRDGNLITVKVGETALLTDADLSAMDVVLESGQIGVGAYDDYTAFDDVVIETLGGPSVEGRHVFYNDSYFDGNDSAANASDDAAIATNKRALLPGGTATFENYTNSSQGINGIMVDIAGLADSAELSAADFAFKVGNDNDPSGWDLAPAPINDIAADVRLGGGLGGSDRVTIIWADNVIEKQWLQVTVLATANTGLAEPEVFYFGNAIGESGNTGDNAFVNITDELGPRNHPRTFLDPAAVDDDYDYNHDHFVNITDELLARNNATNFLTALKLINAPTLGPDAPTSLIATTVSSSQIDLSWADKADDEAGFKIERSLTGITGWSQIDTTSANDTDYSDAGLSANTTYYYRVRAYNASGNSSYSNIANDTTQPAYPSIPNPWLFFSSADISSLQQFVSTNSEANEVYNRIFDRARKMIDPYSQFYVDPEDLGSFNGTTLSYWLESMGIVYVISGNEDYGTHGAAVMAAAANEVVLTPSNRAMMMRAFAVGYDWMAEAATTQQRSDVESACRGYILNMLAAAAENPPWIPYHNYMGYDLGAAGCLALAIKHAYPSEAPNWIADFEYYADLWLDEGFGPEGAYVEGAYYGTWGMKNLMLFAKALERSGGTDLFSHPHLQNAPHYYAMSMLPGEGFFDARNDAYYIGTYYPTMLCLAGAQNSSLAKWIWNQSGGSESAFVLVWGHAADGVSASDPVQAGEPLAEYFTDRGLCIWRTGWGIDDAMFSIEAGPYHYITHSQADRGHFTFYSMGHYWAIDSGYGNKQHPQSNDQGVAHSLVLVNDKSQALCGQGLGVDGEVLSYMDASDYGYAVIDSTDAYNRATGEDPGLGLTHAQRGALFIKPSNGAPAYVVILDDITDGMTNKFTWVMQADSLMTYDIETDGYTLTPEHLIDTYAYTPDDPSLAYSSGECEWTFDVPTSGKYVLWAVVRSVGRDPLTSDSFYVQMDNGSDATWHLNGSKSQHWRWARVEDNISGAPFEYELDPGQHTLSFKTREAGVQISYAFLTPDHGGGPLSKARIGGIMLDVADATAAGVMQKTQNSSVPDDAALRIYVDAETRMEYSKDGCDDHHRLKAWCYGSSNPYFTSLLLPIADGVTAPDVSFDRTGDDVVISVKWTDREDTITWADRDLSQVSVELVELDGGTTSTSESAVGLLMPSDLTGRNRPFVADIFDSSPQTLGVAPALERVSADGTDMLADMSPLSLPEATSPFPSWQISENLIVDSIIATEMVAHETAVGVHSWSKGHNPYDDLAVDLLCPVEVDILSKIDQREVSLKYSSVSEVTVGRGNMRGLLSHPSLWE